MRSPAPRPQRLWLNEFRVSGLGIRDFRILGNIGFRKFREPRAQGLENVGFFSLEVFEFRVAGSEFVCSGLWVVVLQGCGNLGFKEFSGLGFRV